jgi:hypothetical protein
VDHGRLEPHDESGLVKLAEIGDDRHVLVQQLQQKTVLTSISINQQSIKQVDQKWWIRIKALYSQILASVLQPISHSRKFVIIYF